MELYYKISRKTREFRKKGVSGEAKTAFTFCSGLLFLIVFDWYLMKGEFWGFLRTLGEKDAGAVIVLFFIPYKTMEIVLIGLAGLNGLVSLNFIEKSNINDKMKLEQPLISMFILVLANVLIFHFVVFKTSFLIHIARESVIIICATLTMICAQKFATQN
jgi:hypothetical protein